MPPRTVQQRITDVLERFEMGAGVNAWVASTSATGAIHRLEEIFYDKVLADPLLRTVFTQRIASHVDHLSWFTVETFGGPDRFTRELGFQYIIDVHRHLQITDEQRERFVALYLRALDEAGLPDDEPFREAVRRHVEFGAQVAQQNSRAEN